MSRKIFALLKDYSRNWNRWNFSPCPFSRFFGFPGIDICTMLFNEPKLREVLWVVRRKGLNQLFVLNVIQLFIRVDWLLFKVLKAPKKHGLASSVLSFADFPRYGLWSGSVTHSQQQLIRLTNTAEGSVWEIRICCLALGPNDWILTATHEEGVGSYIRPKIYFLIQTHQKHINYLLNSHQIPLVANLQITTSNKSTIKSTIWQSLECKYLNISPKTMIWKLADKERKVEKCLLKPENTYEINPPPLFPLMNTTWIAANLLNTHHQFHSNFSQHPSVISNIINWHTQK